MLIKATRLHPGVPLQVYVAVMLVVESVGWVTMVAMIEATVRWISFLILPLSSIEGHCPLLLP